MSELNEQAKKHEQMVASELHKTRKFMSKYQNARQNQGVMAAFDSLQNDNPIMPESLQKLLDSRNINGKQGLEAVLDGLEMGIETYKQRNGGEMPPTNVILSAFDAALNTCTEHTTDPQAKAILDSLSFDHHEATSVVQAAAQVTIMTNIANALPIVAQLPNPTGSNEVPLVYGRTTAAHRHAMFNVGEYIDGPKSGQPYFENRHTITMKKEGSKFSTDIHVGYKKLVNADGTVRYEVDTDTPKAPFLGGRVVITVKGVAVANDASRHHKTKSGTSVLQPLGDEGVTIGEKTYLVKTARADLDNHSVEVVFDEAKDVPEEHEVEVQVIFDFERKDANGKDYILTPPGLDMTFETASVFAAPSRARVVATIDAITQMQNELGLSWNAAVLGVIQQKFHLEQAGRLLREQVRSCMYQEDRLESFDAQKTGINYTNLDAMFDALKAKLGLARTKLAESLNRPIHGVDIFVGMMGAAVFNAMSDSIYKPTNLSYGDESSIYRIGTLNDGTNVYFVPRSLGVFDETKAKTTASALMLPRAANPAIAPFVGHTAVAPLVLSASPDAFEQQVAVYSRTAAERNPHQDFGNQGMLIQMINIPNI
ncbi:MAG: hypothetical protein Q4B81_00280 [Moraxella sp.]|nr:hypothetical protein [Moraxella sp.]